MRRMQTVCRIRVAAMALIIKVKAQMLEGVALYIV